ncbi:DMT family transporter [Bacillus spongiae]|uniref:DMT family transporter n=1 Tax=Bacillus spongiae TaxID=2683610 RepID=A0ABU8HDP5_9BACI
MVSRKRIANNALLFVAFVWGSTFVIVQKAIAFLPPFSFNFIRFFLASLILFSFYFIHRRTKPIPYSVIAPGILLGFFLFIGYATQTLGLLYTTPARAGFITGLSVVIVPFLALAFSKQRPSIFAITGAILAAFGLYLLSSISSQAINVGDLLVLGCAVAFAVHIFVTEKYAASYSALLLAAIQLLSVSFFSLVGVFLFEDITFMTNVELYLHPTVVVGLLVTILFATAAAFLIQTWAQQFTSSTRVAVIFAMEPVFAALTSFILINEKLTIQQVIGCLLIFIGMIIVELKLSKLKPKQQKNIPS